MAKTDTVQDNELTFEQQQEIDRLVALASTPSSNQNKHRFNLYAYIASLRATPAPQVAVGDEELPTVSELATELSDDVALIRFGTTWRNLKPDEQYSIMVATGELAQKVRQKMKVAYSIGCTQAAERAEVEGRIDELNKLANTQEHVEDFDLTFSAQSYVEQRLRTLTNNKETKQ